MSGPVIASVDPGLNHCGVALWDGEGTLAAAYLARNPFKGKDLELKVHWMVATVNRELVVGELPQVYGPGARGRGKAKDADPNDLISLALVLGGMRPMKLYRPREWKGQVPKDVMVKRILARLKPSEVDNIDWPPASLRHNVADAIGIGLHHFGRL